MAHGRKSNADFLLVTAATPDRVPHIGRIPSKPNQFVLAGSNGHGIPVIFLAGKDVIALQHSFLCVVLYRRLTNEWVLSKAMVGLY